MSMQSRARFLGHPIHPMLVVLPLGLFIAAAVLDGLYYWRGDTLFATLSYYNIAGGILGGLLAAVFGLRDWLAIPKGTRAKRIGLFHGALNVIMVMLFAAVWIARTALPDNAPTTFILAVEAVAISIALVAGWLGGELVDRLGVGVDEGANLNAPNSLSGRPASAGRV
jgi:uncharacterized membrane protein